MLSVFVNCTVIVKQCWENKQLQSSLIRAARRCAQTSGKQDSCSAQDQGSLSSRGTLYIIARRMLKFSKQVRWASGGRRGSKVLGSPLLMDQERGVGTRGQSETLSCLVVSDSVILGSSVHGILQARILEWVAIPLSRGSS